MTEGASLRVAEIELTEAERAEVAAGRFVRVELPEPLAIAKWITTTSVFVGRAPSGRLRAYANVCRHQAVPLDLVDHEPRAAGAPPVPAPLTDDGAMLICLRHGALYRFEDGLCTFGPCAGQALHEVDVSERGGVVFLGLSLLSRPPHERR